MTRCKLLHPKYIPAFTQTQRQESYNLIQKVIDALGSPEIAVDDRHGPKLYSRLLTGLLATVKLDAPYPGRRATSHTRKPSSRNSSSLSSGSPSRLSVSPVRSNATYLDSNQIHHIQVDDRQNSPADGPSGDSPSSMQGLNVQEFFAPPLPFDGELLHSMQNLTNSTEWEGMALPGVHCSSGVDFSPDTDCICHVLRVGLDGWFAIICRHATGHAAAWKLPCAGCICDWRFFCLRFPEILRSDWMFYCGLFAVCGICTVLRSLWCLMNMRGFARLGICDDLGFKGVCILICRLFCGFVLLTIYISP